MKISKITVLALVVSIFLANSISAIPINRPMIIGGVMTALGILVMRMNTHSQDHEHTEMIKVCTGDNCKWIKRSPNSDVEHHHSHTRQRAAGLLTLFGVGTIAYGIFKK